MKIGIGGRIVVEKSSLKRPEMRTLILALLTVKGRWVKHDPWALERFGRDAFVIRPEDNPVRERRA